MPSTGDSDIQTQISHESLPEPGIGQFEGKAGHLHFQQIPHTDLGFVGLKLHIWEASLRKRIPYFTEMNDHINMLLGPCPRSTHVRGPVA